LGLPESVFDAIAKGSSDAVTLHDASGVATAVGGAASLLFGDAARQLRNAPIWSLADAEGATKLENAVKATSSDGSTRYIAWVVQPRYGLGPARFETRVAQLRDDGNTSRNLCITRTVYDRRPGDDGAKRSDESRNIVDRSIFGIYRSTLDGRFVYVNQALVRMLGYDSVDELMAIDIPSQLYADPAEREQLLKRYVEERMGEWTHVRWKMKNGSVVVMRVVVAGIPDAGGELRYFEGFVEDVTERLHREEILRRNERMASLGTMLAGVAHELNNPLAAISGFAQIMLRGDTLNEDDRSAVDTINHEANRAARIVRDLQTFARERSYVQREEVDLNEVVSYVLSSQRYRMDTHGIERVVTLAPALPPVRAERAHVEQILINLLANASQALESITDAPATRGNGSAGRIPPTITVSTAVRGAEVVLEVHDNGPGISPDNLPRIFDPFFTTRREGEGTGLGLAVVHGIVHSYGGNLEVESELGHGSIFRVSFPVAVEGPQETVRGAVDEPEGESAPALTVAKPLEILVVEDELAIRRLLARYFEARGHSVTTAENGMAALREAEQSAFDVVICDLRLPGIDGFEVVRRLRQLPTGERSRCILMSGANAKLPAGPMREVLRLDAIVNKPFEIEQLRAAVEL
jgi:PAS domain S-box-containing protein